MKEFLLAAGTIFLMELGDKTQLAAISFASKQHPLKVYAAVLLGFAVCTVLSVAIGKAAGEFIPEKYLKVGVGVLFIGIGIWTIAGK